MLKDQDQSETDGASSEEEDWSLNLFRHFAGKGCCLP